MDNKLFITRISLKEDIDPKAFDNFPLNINALYFFDELKFTKPVVIFNGENGCGKSTLIEAIADLLNLPIAGGNRNMDAFVESNMPKGNESAPLSKYLRVAKSYKKPYRSYFFRAESFHELSTLIDEDSKRVGPYAYLNNSNFCSKDLLNQSHGESFMDLISHQFTEDSLFLLDEPESALSPENQFKLLVLIDRLSKEGSQFIMATHSPILLGYRDAVIINLDNGMHEIKYKETKIYQMYHRFINNPEKYQKLLLDEEYEDDD